MIKITEKITETDVERSQSLNYIESIEKEKSLSKLKGKSRPLKKCTFHPEDNTITENLL